MASRRKRRSAAATARARRRSTTAAASCSRPIAVATRSSIVDPTAKKITGTAKLAGNPDYVRWVEPAKEVWVTEPGKKQIEYFAFDGAKLVRKGAIDVPGGPESLVIDATRGRAYTHTWDDATVVIDLAKHKEVARWKNGCEGSRGIALDEKRGFLFVGCEEGKATALDVAHDGKQLGTVDTGKGVDIIAYNPALAHLYVPGGDSATLTIIGVDAAGKLAVARHRRRSPRIRTASTADDSGHAYVCDPKHGALLVVTDPFPSRSEARVDRRLWRARREDADHRQRLLRSLEWRQMRGSLDHLHARATDHRCLLARMDCDHIASSAPTTNIVGTASSFGARSVRPSETERMASSMPPRGAER